MNDSAGHSLGVPPGRSETNVPVRPVIDLTPEWATAIARQLLGRLDDARQRGWDPPVVDECWIAADRGIYIRYSIPVETNNRVGWIILESNIDPTSGGYALSPEDQGSHYFHTMHTPELPQWTDRLGYGWFRYGSPPRPSWEAAVEQQPRLVTLRARNGEAS